MERVSLASVRGPLAVCDDAGTLIWMADETQALLERVAFLSSEGCAREAVALPGALWRALSQVPAGRVVEWRPSSATPVLECVRYPADDAWLLLFTVLADEQAALASQLHRQRLEVTGRLVASVAHELRNSVSSIVYSADLLLVRDALPADAFYEAVDQIMAASRRLRATVDGLLDYARLGPAVSVPVSLRHVLTRAQGFLRSRFKPGGNQLRVSIAPDAEWVQGNSIVVEQVFVNLLLNAAESNVDPITVEISTELVAAPDGGPPKVRVRVQDDGLGVPHTLRERIFQPFVTSREHGTGLGLAHSREAVESMSGSIVLEDEGPGATFTIYLVGGAEP